jgi:hypothetical protein
MCVCVHATTRANKKDSARGGGGRAFLFFVCFLPTATCFLPTAACFLPTATCFLPTAACFRSTATNPTRCQGRDLNRRDEGGIHFMVAPPRAPSSPPWYPLVREPPSTPASPPVSASMSTSASAVAFAFTVASASASASASTVASEPEGVEVIDAPSIPRPTRVQRTPRALSSCGGNLPRENGGEAPESG